MKRAVEGRGVRGGWRHGERGWMKSWARQLRERSYSKAFIWKSSLSVALAGIVLGKLASMLTPPPDLDAFGLGELSESDFMAPLPGDGVQRLGIGQTGILDYLRDESRTVEEIIAVGPLFGGYLSADSIQALEADLIGNFGEAVGGSLALYLIALEPGGGAAQEILESRAERRPPPRYANRLAGELALREENYAEAYRFFRAEGEFEEAAKSRERAVMILRQLESYAELSEVLQEPLYREFSDVDTRIDLAVWRRDWAEVAKLLPRQMFSGADAGLILLGLVPAVVWSALLLLLGQVGRWSLAGLCGLAFLAGVASTLPTLFWVIVQDAYVDYRPDGDLLFTVAYFVGGVGLREEFCKLLLFSPFLPLVARRRDERMAWLLASFVGLGFAAQENINYFVSSLGGAAPARLLTANFFHVALTGMCGLFLARGAMGRGMTDFLYIFGVMVVAHGLYNALFFLPQLGAGGFLSMIIFILVAMYYFKEYNGLYSPRVSNVSLTWTLAMGLSLLLAALIVYQSARVGLGTTLVSVFSEFLGVALMLALFTREFNEPLRS